MNFKKNLEELEEYNLKKIIKNKNFKKSPNNQNGFMDLSNIKSGAYYKTEDKKVPKDMKSDLIIVNKNNIIYGKCRPKLDKAIISKESGFTTGESLVYETDYPYFITALFHHKDFISYNVNNATGAKMPRTSNNTVLSYNFHSSKNLNFKKIDLIVKKQIELIELYNEKLSLLEEQESYYQDELLSGRLRIRLTQESINYVTSKGWYQDSDIVKGKEAEFEAWLEDGFEGKVEFYLNEVYIEKNVNGKNIKVSNDFSVETLGELSKSIKTGKLNANASKNNGKYPFFTCSKETKKINKYSFDQEAILIAGNGEVGESKYYNGKFDAYQRTYVLGDFQIHSMFLFKYIKNFFKKYLENRSVGGVIKFIKINDIKEFNIIKPNNTAELISVFTMISKMEHLSEKIKEKVKIEEEKMDYLIDELLSGRIRVE